MLKLKTSEEKKKKKKIVLLGVPWVLILKKSQKT